MNSGLSKILQNVEVRLRGRTAVIGCALAALTIICWLLLQDYRMHPTLSNVGVGAVILVMLVVILAATFAGTRPEELPAASLIQVNHLGIFMASGIASERQAKELLRDWNGLARLPAPDARVDGSASREKDYRQLSRGESDALLAEVEAKSEGMLGDKAREIIATVRRTAGEGTGVPRMADGGRAQGEAPLGEEPLPGPPGG